MDDLQEQLGIGNQAEEFLKYVSEHPYFEGMLERIRLEYGRQILSLLPEETAIFTALRTKMDAIDDVMNVARNDVLIGSDALKKLSGESEQPKGIL